MYNNNGKCDIEKRKLNNKNYVINIAFMIKPSEYGFTMMRNILYRYKERDNTLNQNLFDQNHL